MIILKLMFLYCKICKLVEYSRKVSPHEQCISPFAQSLYITHGLAWTEGNFKAVNWWMAGPSYLTYWVIAVQDFISFFDASAAIPKILVMSAFRWGPRLCVLADFTSAPIWRFACHVVKRLHRSAISPNTDVPRDEMWIEWVHSTSGTRLTTW